ncbi:hypothetical protein [Kibdelosporangium phytohabitans]|uniref:Asp23/Gls24 family envelope stress response protein n=1 Tax=Kibdelosporangium phytohabitans TaxID=860235 RepID=A0A0N9HT49_9PSEU|nr:hypothetical protein [Kibdelosporangium phytohabitans]ALG06045.1 hypothetical protein AOZ06_03140 [Kibdelosporangium phytohabitans]MBE1465878.1 putative alkaline shock family protein YloU [Kibdelosporangium phytohabitans]
MTTALPALVDRGRTTVADRVVSRVAQAAAAEDQDVVSAKTNARVNGTTTALEVRVGLRYPAPVGTATERLRGHLIERVEHLTGMSVSQVDISVTALTTDRKEHRRVQ